MNLEQLYRRYYQELVYDGLKFIPDIQVVQDIVVDVILKVSKKGYPNIANVLYSSVRNKCIDHLRKDKRESKGNRLFSEQDIEHSQLEAVVLRSLSDAIKELTNGSREVIEMYYFKEMNCVEIAAKLNKKESTIRSLKRHGIEQLFKLIKISTLWAYIQRTLSE